MRTMHWPTLCKKFVPILWIRCVYSEAQQSVTYPQTGQQFISRNVCRFPTTFHGLPSQTFCIFSPCKKYFNLADACGVCIHCYAAWQPLEVRLINMPIRLRFWWLIAFEFIFMQGRKPILNVGHPFGCPATESFCFVYSSLKFVAFSTLDVRSCALAHAGQHGRKAESIMGLWHAAVLTSQGDGWKRLLGRGVWMGMCGFETNKGSIRIEVNVYSYFQ